MYKLATMKKTALLAISNLLTAIVLLASQMEVGFSGVQYPCEQSVRESFHFSNPYQEVEPLRDCLPDYVY